MNAKNYTKLTLVLILIFYCSIVSSQVTIGHSGKPRQGALLDLSENDSIGENSKKGLVLPRVQLTNLKELNPIVKTSDSRYSDLKKELTGLMVFNPKEDITPNIIKATYIWDGDKWNPLFQDSKPTFYYFPPFMIGSAGANLFDQYKSLPTYTFASPGAPTSCFPTVSDAEDLIYYVNGYDTTTFKNVALTKDGKLTYDIKGRLTEESYINIAFSFVNQTPMPDMFYLGSLPIDSSTGKALSIKLESVYRNSLSSVISSNPSSDKPVPEVSNFNNFYCYVFYDPSVFKIKSIDMSNAGTMQYEVISSNIPDNTESFLSFMLVRK